jgi:hypothetical protein
MRRALFGLAAIRGILEEVEKFCYDYENVTMEDALRGQKEAAMAIKKACDIILKWEDK